MVQIRYAQLSLRQIGGRHDLCTSWLKRAIAVWLRAVAVVTCLAYDWPVTIVLAVVHHMCDTLWHAVRADDTSGTVSCVAAVVMSSWACSGGHYAVWMSHGFCVGVAVCGWMVMCCHV